MCRPGNASSTRIPVLPLTSLEAAQSSRMNRRVSALKKKKAGQSQPAFDLVVLWSDQKNVAIPVYKSVVGFVVEKCGADKQISR